MGDCSDGPHGPLADWDVSRITDMKEMFKDASSFNTDLSKWDVSSVTNMDGMFIKASSFNGDLSKWDVSSVTNMYTMFYLASSFNGDLSKWDVSSVTNMNIMFQGASSFNQRLCGAAWVFSKASKDYMFYGSSGSISTTLCGLWCIGIDIVYFCIAT